jgi:signal transduction histidine kinase
VARSRDRVLGNDGAVKGSEADSRLLRRARWRLVAWSGGTTLVVLLVLGTVFYGAVANQLATAGRQQLQARINDIRLEIERPVFRPGQRPKIGISIGGPASGTFAYVVMPNGTTFGPAEFSIDGLPDQSALAAARSGERDVRELSVDGTPLRLLTQSVTNRAAGTVLVQIGQDRTGEQKSLDVLLATLVGVGIVGLVGAIGVGFVYSGRALVPIRESLRRQREFAADASHELRTPLAVIRSSVEHLERNPERPVREVGDALGDIRDEVDHLTALVGDLLLLARTDSGVIELERSPVDLADVALEAIGTVSSLAARRGVRIVLDPSPAPTLGDPLRLRQLVTILVDNAIAHSPTGGTVTVRVRTTRQSTDLRVEDEGPGLAADEIPHVFDRFWRAPGAPAGGTGLGLAIAAWIVERHEGTIGAGNRPTGGAVFDVRLPLAEASPNPPPRPDSLR